ncbi:hypothetical protein O6H91_14G043800 [Diphasiastrum complanatum]|uniref:Uncharacterized protein n=1 Tax=Diphasiastrum complanatum TaxID=34168 RepID=A0ACC2BNS1_DIPCM|nr:hypothetical protein O6H91_14G043800 [Diphasiastrum complanatum]
MSSQKQREMMYTNIFRLGGLQTVSWFQLLPESKDENAAGARIPEEFGYTGGAKQVLEAHLRLQNEGQLSAWTVSPEQEANVKLWLFLPGRQENGTTTVQPVLAGLVVVGSGIWRSPGICDDVSFALCQALRNRLERALNLLGYARFGDIFVKCKQLGSTEISARKSLPSFEMHFAASEEAIFIHFVVCRRRLRPLTTADMHATLAQQLEADATPGKNIFVLLSPYGMIGKLTGCCPGDLVKQLYQSKVQASDDYLTARNMLLLPCTSGNPAAFFRTWYAEVCVSYFSPGNSKIRPGCLSSPDGKSVSQLDFSERKPGDAKEKKNKGSIPEGFEEVELSFIFPPEAVLVPISPPISPQAYRRRCWLQNWAGTGWLEDLSFGNKLGSTQQPCERSGPFGSLSNSVGWTNGSYQPKSSSSYSSTSTSSGGSSIKSSSSRGTSGTDSEVEGGADSDEGLKADAESLGITSEKSEITVQNKVSASVSMHASLQPLHFDGGMAESNFVQGSNTSLKRERSKLMSLPDDAPAKTARKGNTFGDMSGFFEGGSIGTSKTACNQDEMNGLLLGMPSNTGVSTAKGVMNQATISWDWNEEVKGIGMEQNDADIFAEFGDFGDFFEDDALGFGEPPGTAESQALMFSLADCGEGTNTPGTVSMDTSDPMLLPILDFPMLEGFGQQILPKELNFQEQDDDKTLKETSTLSPEDTPPIGSTLTKAEAVMLFSPEYAAVDVPFEKCYNSSKKQCAYVPDNCKAPRSPNEPDSYVYSASPPPMEVGNWKFGQVEKIKSEEQGMGRLKLQDIASSHHSGDINEQNIQFSVTYKNLNKSNLPEVPLEASAGHDSGHHQSVTAPSIGSRDGKATVFRKFAKKHQECHFSSVSVVASELECALFHIKARCSKGVKPCCELKNSSAARSLKDGDNKSERTPDIFIKQSNASVRQYEQRKKDHIPVRIAGDADEQSHDGPRAAEIGVWRPVGTPKSQKVGGNFENDFSRFGSSTGCVGTAKQSLADSSIRSDVKTSQWEEALVAIPLLVQQAVIANDISLNGDYRDGPLDWLEHHPDARTQSFFECTDEIIGSLDAAFMHADQSTFDAVDPLVAEVSPATVATLLQSDVRQAMVAAFGDVKLAGPLKVADWCRGKVPISESTQTGDTSSAGCGYSDSKDLASSITVAVGEPITPPQCTGGGLSGSKAYTSLETENQAGDFRRSRTNRALDASSLSDHIVTDAQRRVTQDPNSADTDIQASGASCSPTFTALPVPALLVGYQDDWLKVSSGSLRLWEKAPLEPYALPKPVTYYVVSLNSEPLLSAASDFFQQLSTVYEACRLGTHTPATVTAPISGRHSMQGLLTVDVLGNQNQASSSSSSFSLASAHVVNMDCSWNLSNFRKSLRKVCKSVQIMDKSVLLQRDPEHSPCIVVYVISPSADPAVLLQTLIDACEALGLSAGFSEDYYPLRYNLSKGSASLDEYIHSVPTLFGFANARLALQLVSPDVIFKLSNSLASGSDFLKEIAFGVYSKVRRLPQKFATLEGVQNIPSKVRSVTAAVGQTGGAMSGLWKDCTAVVPMVGNTFACTGNWDNSRQSSRLPEMGTDSSMVGSDRHLTQSPMRFLYEPLFILADPGSLDLGVSNLLPNIRIKDKSGALEEGGGNALMNRASVTSSADSVPAVSFEVPDTDASDCSQRQVSSFHCCYAWTDDWQWLVSVWTDSRGELLDIHIFPLPGISQSQDGKGLHSLFMQMLEQGLQLLSATAEVGNGRPHSIIFARIGEFYDLECQEWHRALTTLGGDDVRSWPVQICPSVSDQMVSTALTSIQQRELTTVSERNLGLASSGPASPSTSTLLTSRNIGSGFVKGDRVHGSSTKLLTSSNNLMQLVQSISFVTIRVDHSLQILYNSDMVSPPGSLFGNSSFFHLPKPLPTANGAYVIVPAHGLRYLSFPARHLSSSINSDLPYIAKVLSSKGLCNPVASGWVLSGTMTSARTDLLSNHMDEGWPSVLHVALVTHFSRHNHVSGQDASSRLGGGNGLCDSSIKFKSKKTPVAENKEHFVEAQHALGGLIAELYALSWLNVSPMFPRRISPLPFHCAMALRLKKLFGFMDGEIGLSSLHSRESHL